MNAGTTQAVKLADQSLAVMDAVFAPFDKAASPTQLSVSSLIHLLESPFANRVPLPPSTYQSVNLVS